MDRVIDRFTAGFGICFKRPPDTIFSTRKLNNCRKLGRSIPIVALVITILQMENRRRFNKQQVEKYTRPLGARAFALRGILYGSVIGIPVGLVFDVVGTVLQAIYAIRNRSKPLLVDPE